MSQTPRTSLFDAPAYRAAEAARLLALPTGTVTAWSFGQDYQPVGGKRKRFHALLAPADSKARLLSFNNLCELHMLAAIRRHYRISMPASRTARPSAALHAQRSINSTRFSGGEPVLESDGFPDVGLIDAVVLGHVGR